jgi:caffeoyl-CoA O-methyltransferase
MSIGASQRLAPYDTKVFSRIVLKPLRTSNLLSLAHFPFTLCTLHFPLGALHLSIMTMIPDLEKYFRGFLPPRAELLLRLEAEAEQERIPIVGPVVGELLFILARAMQARRILELGTATGYSTIYLAQAVVPESGQVLTLELDPAMAQRAERNISTAGLSHRVEVKIGPAQALMADLSGPFDLIFMDIDKEGYLPALAGCHQLLRLGGLLIVDNTGFQGAADFNRALANDRHWRSVNLLTSLPRHSPEKDGLALAIKIADSSP